MGETNKEENIKVGPWEKQSYCLSQGMAEFLPAGITGFALFFYESEIMLNPMLVIAAFLLYGLWNAVNDPLLGWYTDHTFKFTRKWGRRLPRVISGVIIESILFIFIFAPPNVNPVTQGWIIFAWALIFLCAHDTAYTLWNINSESLIVVKFPEEDERRRVSGIRAFYGVIGVFLAFLIPPLFIEEGVVQSYLIMAIVLAIIGFIGGVIMIPGHRENKELIDHYFNSGAAYAERENFIKEFISSIKKKNFALLVMLSFVYAFVTESILISLIYFVIYNLDASVEAVIYPVIGYLIGATITIPIWTKLSNKMRNNKKLIVIGALFLGLATLTFLFINSVIWLLIAGIIIGVPTGLFFAIQDAVYADVVDEVVSIDGTRREASLFGIKSLVQRIALAIVPVIVVGIHILTGFDPATGTQSELALFGIRLHIALIPGILLMIGGLLFWKFYDLTPEKLKNVRAKIKELGI